LWGCSRFDGKAGGMEVRKKAGEKGAAATSLGFGRAPSLFDLVL